MAEQPGLRERITEILTAIDEAEEMDSEGSVYEIDDELVDKMVDLLRDIGNWYDQWTGAGNEPGS